MGRSASQWVRRHFELHLLLLSAHARALLSAGPDRRQGLQAGHPCRNRVLWRVPNPLTAIRTLKVVAQVVLDAVGRVGRVS